MVAIKHFGVDVAVTRRTPDGVELQSRVLRNGFKATVTKESGGVQVEKVTQAKIDGNLAKLEGDAATTPAGPEQPVADAGSSQEPADIAPIEPASQAAKPRRKASSTRKCRRAKSSKTPRKTFRICRNYSQSQNHNQSQNQNQSLLFRS